MRCIIEAGHYYQCHGPTIWSTTSWKILQQVRSADDDTLLFIDDVHDLNDMQDNERMLPVQLFDPQVSHVVLESTMRPLALEILEQLAHQPRRSRAKQRRSGCWYWKDIALTNSAGFPLCTLLDVALSAYKHQLGHSSAVNILPEFYEQQQINLQRILRVILPELRLRTILFDLDENWRWLGDSEE